MNVLLIDDHALFRIGLEGLLERREIEVIESVSNGIDGISRARELKPDVILRDNDINIPVVMLTTSSEERDLIESLRNGAQGYLLKDMDPDDLVNALHDIVAGKTVVAPELAGVLAKVVQQGNTSTATEPAPFADLTPREHEILCHLAEGQSNKVIARKLGISDGTVKLHVKAVLRKLGVHSRVEAAVIAVEQELCQKT